MANVKCQLQCLQSLGLGEREGPRPLLCVSDLPSNSFFPKGPVHLFTTLNFIDYRFKNGTRNQCL